jgi:hypothetical protein
MESIPALSKINTSPETEDKDTGKSVGEFEEPVDI